MPEKNQSQEEDGAGAAAAAKRFIVFTNEKIHFEPVQNKVPANDGAKMQSWELWGPQH